jgi:two-component system OmpR family sensor kinase
VTDMAQRRYDPASLRADVERLEKTRKITISLYFPDGRLMATTIEPPLPFPAPRALANLERAEVVDLAPWYFAHAVREDGRLVAIGVARHVEPPPFHEVLLRPLIPLLVLLVIVAFVFARHLVRPLQEIVGATSAFGRGQLGIRLRSSRRDEIGGVARAFDDMADRVGRLVTSQQELMANVSHELQTPLSRIRVAVDLMIEGDRARAEEMLGEITRDLEELEELIERVMTLARLDLARVGASARAPREGVRVEELLGRSVERFRSLHDTHVLEVDLGGELGNIVADAVLLRRALDNVLDNARKYSADGSRITLAAERSGERARIEIRDQGIGIDAGDLDKIFTPFFRTDRSRSRATGGVGLGLALSRRVIEAHGGSVRINSQVGQGTVVSIELPVG